MRRSNPFVRALPLLAVMLALGLPASASNYTAIPDKTEATKTEKSAKEPEKTCMESDYELMKDYEKRLSEFSHDVSEGSKRSGEMGKNKTMRDDYLKIHMEFGEFLKSEEFERVKLSYKVCKVEMPSPFTSEDFWKP
ncbi:MAG: hypothetical protein KDI90_00990 [Alphaproteobacteria bacterium]|nr:hypothetical protein [Alphaproteobacteria bacterium]